MAGIGIFGHSRHLADWYRRIVIALARHRMSPASSRACAEP